MKKKKNKIVEDTCKHGISPSKCCSYCSGLVTESNFDGIVSSDSFTAMLKFRLSFNRGRLSGEIDEGFNHEEGDIEYDQFNGISD